MRCKKCGSQGISTSVRQTGRRDFRCRNCKSKAKPIFDAEDVLAGITEKRRSEGLKAGILITREVNSLGLNYSKSKLIIGDLHAPYTLKGYLEFIISIQKKYNISPNNIYNVGDIVDNHAISLHDHNPSLAGPSQELKNTIEYLRPWYKAFPIMKIATGNHDELPVRRAVKYGLPEEYLKGYLEVLKAPVGWEMRRKWWLDKNTVMEHGTGFSGKYPHANMAAKKMCNTIMGHIHAVAGVHHIVNERTRVWGMCVGCGIDRSFPAFNYARNYANKPVIACGVLLDGNIPIIEMMDL